MYRIVEISIPNEPAGDLDNKTGGKIIANLRSLNELGQTIIMVTQSPEAAKAAHRLLRVQDGILV